MKPTHTLVALHLPRSHADLIVYANHIVQAMTKNAHFPTPTPPLATVTTDIQVLEAAEVTAKHHAKGDAQARDLALTKVVSDIHGLGAYVQSVADANEAEAAAIIASAGMGTHPHGVHAKPELAAHMGPGGLVILRALAAGKHAAYEWQMSTDAGKTWTALPVTNKANTTVSGLAIGATVAFRFRATVGSAAGDWSQTVTLLVH